MNDRLEMNEYIKSMLQSYIKQKQQAVLNIQGMKTFQGLSFELLNMIH